jgi:hypothetical protein
MRSGRRWMVRSRARTMASSWSRVVAAWLPRLLFHGRPGALDGIEVRGVAGPAASSWSRPGCLERGDHERESVLPGQQADGDLRFQAAFLEKPGSRKPSPRLASK